MRECPKCGKLIEVNPRNTECRKCRAQENRTLSEKDTKALAPIKIINEDISTESEVIKPKLEDYEEIWFSCFCSIDIDFMQSIKIRIQKGSSYFSPSVYHAGSYITNRNINMSPKVSSYLRKYTSIDGIVTKVIKGKNNTYITALVMHNKNLTNDLETLKSMAMPIADKNKRIQQQKEEETKRKEVQRKIEELKIRKLNPDTNHLMKRNWFVSAISRMNRLDKQLLLSELYLEKQKANDEQTHNEIKFMMNKLQTDRDYSESVRSYIIKAKGFTQQDSRDPVTKAGDFFDKALGVAFDMVFSSGKVKRPYSRRVTHCRNCGKSLDSASHSRCRRCNWIVCPSCRTCGCGS